MTMKMTINKMVRHVAMLAVLVCCASPAIAGNCLLTGGTLLCTKAIPTSDWRYSLCDDWGAYVSRQVAWCTVYGGKWGDTGCVGANVTVTEGNGHSLAEQFENLVHPPSGCGSGPPPGPCTNYNCSCGTASRYGIVTSDFSVMPFSGMTRDSLGNCSSPWAENVILNKDRDVGCPTGYNLGWGDADKPCGKFPPCLKCLGNPIDVGNGAKVQVETDYASPAPGGLSFARYFSSDGFYDPASRMETTDDHWRHTFSSHVIPITGSSYVMAQVQRPDGSLRTFNLSGVEIQNVDGAAWRLQKQADAGGNVTGWTLTTADFDVESYDAGGKLTAISTRAGFTTSLAYDGTGRLITATDSFGRSITLGYDVAGRLGSMTDSASRTYQYGYDDLGRPTTVTYPGGSTRKYVYEDTRFPLLLTGIIDERGVRFATYAYDTMGRGALTQHAGQAEKYAVNFPGGYSPDGSLYWSQATDAFGTLHTHTFANITGALKLKSESDATGAVSWTYDAYGNPATRTDHTVTTTFVYDPARNLETSRTEASGTSVARTITTTWHPTFRLPATITEPSGVAGVNLITTFSYDASGNLIKKNMTAGAKVREWNYTYNARGQVLTIDGPRTDVSDVTAITYFGDSDPCTACRGQVATLSNAAGQVTTFNSYDADGRPTQVTDANGVVTTLTYKPRGWLASRSVAGETTTYDYDPAGNLVKVTLPDASWVAYSYDDAARLVGVDDSLGNSIDYVVDAMGNRVQENAYDPAGVLRRTLQRVYDAANRLQRELGAQLQTTENVYDQYRNVVNTTTDPLSRVTTNSYDGLNRLTNVKDAANGNTGFTYDAKDRLTSVKDPKLSTTTTYTYDGLGNLMTQSSPDTGNTSFTYDAAGNVSTHTDARGIVTTYSYDALNRVTAATVADGTVTYEYDNVTVGGAYAKGRLTTLTDPSGNTTYTYDALGRVTSKLQAVSSSPASKTFRVDYAYGPGRQAGLTYPSGRVIAYGFNASGQVSSLTVDGATILGAAEYLPFGAVKKWVWGNGQVYERSYDLDGRVDTLTTGPSTGTYGDLSQVFGYDSLNRLISAQLAAGQSQSFVYDANGNRTSATVNGAATTYIYPATSHRLTSLSGATTRSFTYDAAGNTTASAGVTYVYDGRGRMKQAGSTTYLVNGLGQRVKKSMAGGDTYFAYDEAGHLIGEYDTSGAAIEETVWLGDMPVAVLKPAASGGGADIFYIWADHLGTPRLITDAANNSRWEWPGSDPFGNNAPNENPAGLGIFAYNLRFPGQYFDSETGKHYNYFRDYDPAIGRYIESDPIGLKGGISTYGYVGGRPLTSFDPEGLQIVCLPPFGCFPLPPPPVPPPSGGGSLSPGGSNVIPFPGQGSKDEPKSCPPEPEDYCSKEQRRLETNKKFCLALQSISASGYRACAVPINEGITQHNLFCPKNRVEKLPLPGPRSAP